MRKAVARGLLGFAASLSGAAAGYCDDDDDDADEDAMVLAKP